MSFWTADPKSSRPSFPIQPLVHRIATTHVAVPPVTCNVTDMWQTGPKDLDYNGYTGSIAVISGIYRAERKGYSGEQKINIRSKKKGFEFLSLKKRENGNL